MSKNTLRSRRRELAKNHRCRNVAAGLESLETRALLAGITSWNGEVAASSPIIQASSAAQTNVGQNAPPFPLTSTFALHSNPGSLKRIYLDFDGHVTTNTQWNTVGLPSFTTPAFDFDGNPADFSVSEQDRIQRIWQRVAEDFAPFDVDITTEYPGEEALVRRSTADPIFGMRVAIGGDSSDWLGVPAGGVALLGTFYEVVPLGENPIPCFAFSESQLNDEQILGETVSHEAGHTLGLLHDGTGNQGYYPGHGQGATSWGPIMGAAFGISVTQWNNGTYPGANNFEDDLAIISDRAVTGVGYRADEYGDTIATATPIQLNSDGSVVIGGIITTRTDADYVRLQLPGGLTTFNFNPAPTGPNLDILGQLYDSGGNLVASDNQVDALNATFTVNLAAGTYYVRIDGVGKGASAFDPGYSDYGSLGQYTISTRVDATARVQGFVYADAGNDGTRNAGDQGLGGFRVFSDDNLNGEVDSSESVTTTAADGTFDLAVTRGQRNVRVELPLGYISTDPRAGYRSLGILSSSQIVTGAPFGVWGLPGQISGFKYIDYNSNGIVDANLGEGPMQGIYIWVDRDGDGRISAGEPGAVTDANGFYSIKNISIGNHTVREVVSPGTATAFPSTNNGTYALKMTPAASFTSMNFFNSPAYEWGDAPDSYKTLRSSNGPVHAYVSGYGLGARTDVDPDGQPNVSATGDDNAFLDDEDGVVFVTPIIPGKAATVQITTRVPSSAPGFVNAWFDWNADGDFSDAGERGIQGQQRGSGTFTFTVNVPATAKIGATFARFRYGPESDLASFGASASGEVEDYKLNILNEKPTPYNDRFTVTQFSSNNRLDVLANDVRGVNGPIKIVRADFPTAGITTANGGLVKYATNGTPTNFADDLLIYNAPAKKPAGTADPLTDEFFYRVTDGQSNSRQVKVTIIIDPVPVAPQTVDDIATTRALTAVRVNVLANDIPGTRGNATLGGPWLDSVTQPATATVTINDNGTAADKSDDYLIVTPRAGADTIQFRYNITNPNLTTPKVSGLVTVQVRSNPDLPGPGDLASFSFQVFPNGANNKPDLANRVDVGGGPYNLVQNQTYWVAVVGDDLRTAFNYQSPPPNRIANGLLSAYLDVSYEKSLVQIQKTGTFGTEDVLFNTPYATAQGGAQSVDSFQDGFINEIGAATTAALGDQQIPIFFLKFKPTTLSNTAVRLFQSDPAEKRFEINTIGQSDVQIVNATDTNNLDRVSVQNIAYLRSNPFRIVAAAPVASSASLLASPAPAAKTASSSAPAATPTASSSGSATANSAALLAYLTSQGSATLSSSSSTKSTSTAANDKAIASLFGDDLLS